MVFPVDSHRLPSGHRSASARPSAQLKGADETAVLRVWAAVARERAQHVSCSACDEPDLHPGCMVISSDSASCALLHLLLALS